MHFHVGQALKSSFPLLITPHRVKTCQTRVSTHWGSGSSKRSEWIHSSFQLAAFPPGEPFSVCSCFNGVIFLFFACIGKNTNRLRALIGLSIEMLL